MRQAEANEVEHNVMLGVNRVGNSWFQTLAGRDIAKREAAATQVCAAVLAKFRRLMVFDVNSMPVDQEVIEGLICGAVLALGPLTYNAARAGHQGTRRDAHQLITDRIVEQLAPFEILVNDPLEPHGEKVGEKRP